MAYIPFRDVRYFCCCQTSVALSFGLGHVHANLESVIFAQQT